uniref:HAP1 N-terminal domain-containing protein n=1 Tax=Oryzias latipes TaxID=8090 RepID=A0A3P9LTQ7_ORYLA
CRDAETITDVCNSTDLPEFEIISLLEEQLPVYRLRADTVYGYDNDDWLHTPLVASDASLELTSEQIEETLKYFLLCADRVGQMTKTYNDIDAVTRLLEEVRQRDLELAAKIGQSLLKKNRTLTEQNDYLEEQVGQITEEQLAQPHLGVILDARPGVVPKGYRPLELELEQVKPVLPSVSPAVPPSFDPTETSSGQPPPSAYFPGKCMPHTSSTYTFTTCRILHPTDEQTQVTPSLNPTPAASSCVMTSSLLATPAATPCTPRRLSLRPSESSTNLRDATRTTSTSLGLVRLLQERGISAGAPNPDLLRPPTPPNSPTRPAISAASSSGFDFKSPSYDNFLASKPARSILKEVTGGARGRQRGRDCESQTDVSVSVHNLNLLDKVKRLGVAGAPGGRAMSPGPILGPLGGLRRSSSPFAPDRMRRNRSYPAMVSASMAMKGPGPQP